MIDHFRDNVRALELIQGVPQIDGVRLLAAFAPDLVPGRMALAGVIALLPATFLAGGLMLTSAAGPVEDTNALNALTVFAILGAPPAGLVTAAGALRAQQLGVRAAVLVLCIGIWMLFAATCATGLWISGDDWMRFTGFAFGAAAGTAIALILSGVALWCLARVPTALSEAMHTERTARAVELLSDRGSLKVAQLAAALGTSDHDAVELVRELVTDGSIAARIDEDAGRITTATRVAGRTQLLLDRLGDQPEHTLRELASLVRLPVAEVRTWIDDLVRAGTLDAAVDDDAVRVSQISSFEACTACGGPSRASQCARCGTP